MKHGIARGEAGKILRRPSCGGVDVTGTLIEGEVTVGSALRILGPSRELSAAARSLHTHGEAREKATAPARLAINLATTAFEQGATLVNYAPVESLLKDADGAIEGVDVVVEAVPEIIALKTDLFQKLSLALSAKWSAPNEQFARQHRD